MFVVEFLNPLQKLLTSILVRSHHLGRCWKELIGSLVSRFESAVVHFLSVCVCPLFWRNLAQLKRSLMFWNTWTKK